MGIRYHLYIQPERESVYQTLQMAVSMAIDLGINKPPLQAIPSEHDIVPNVRVLFASRVRISPEELESRRTFLGCYYLSSAYVSTTVYSTFANSMTSVLVKV
jgi:hypothetical protein